MHHMRGEHLRDSDWVADDRQHSLPKLPWKQRPYFGLWLVHVQRQLLRAVRDRNDWGLHWLPCEQHI
jgi:hypothetical protein